MQSHDPPPSEACPNTLELNHSGRKGPWILQLGGVGGDSARLLEVGRTLTLGTSLVADIRVNDPTVSARHCTLEVTHLGVEVRDLDSTNGTFVGSARVGRALLTKAESVVVVGRTTLAFYPPGSSDKVEEVEPIPGMVGRSPAMQRLYRELRQFAGRRGNILLQGESGSGKEVVAHAIHRLSGRSGEFVAQNASCLPEALADATLFGSRKGAFTGALADRPGVFQAADRGTLFLDEVVDLSLAVQSKLLRAVEEGAVRPVGGVASVQLDVRLVSACWADLEERVRAGAFRSDLFYRIATTVIRVPSLRERKADIADLSSVLLKRRLSDLGPKRLSSDALARLVDYGWPGNVRELDNVVYAAAVRAPTESISASHIQLPKIQRVSRHPDSAINRKPSDFRALLDQNSGNMSAAARAAGLPRSTFRARLMRRLNEGPADGG
ncbi:MAG: sigma 54-interacting transcriptional regulator [Polyangiaceae bacterium]|nr:sigma 54-interacting transcriptional regulator [Polyangiaceae bacterium]